MHGHFVDNVFLEIHRRKRSENQHQTASILHNFIKI